MFIANTRRVRSRVGGMLAVMAFAAAMPIAASSSADSTKVGMKNANANAAPSPLLAIDQNRTSVVDRIVRDWGAALAESGAGLSSDELRVVLNGLRAD